MSVPPDTVARDDPSRHHMPPADGQPTLLLDRVTLIERFAGDAGLFDEVAAIFVEDYPRMRGLLHEACVARDLTALRGAAHAVKGAVSHFSDGPACVAVAALERLAEAGRPDAFDAVDGVVHSLDEFAAAIAAAHVVP